MFIGLDYGTSQCAVAAATAAGVTLVPLDGDQPFLLSCLYAAERCLIGDWVAQQLVGEEQRVFLQRRQALMRQVPLVKRDLQINRSRDALAFGARALQHHMADPTEGYFIKSPKSFLGASGLRADMVDFFEDVVTVMLMEIKQRAEAYLQTTLTGAVIGRPVNFQGINAAASNAQAQNILLAAARRAGLGQVEFLYEPLAAGFDFEQRLQEDRKVLVVDIGGGTTDCSIVLMGPSHRDKTERQSDFLAHTGERVGGNDFDIRLALQSIMPEFGLHSRLKSDLPMPVMPFVQATAVNDVAAQSEFYAEKTRVWLDQLMRDTLEPEKFRRFVHLRERRQNFILVNRAEQAKIALSDNARVPVDLREIDDGLHLEIQLEQLNRAGAAITGKILELARAAINQAGCSPDLIYLTGGSAKSRLVRDALTRHLGTEVPLIDGDFFGSVVKGLGVWAELRWKQAG